MLDSSGVGTSAAPSAVLESKARRSEVNRMTGRLRFARIIALAAGLAVLVPSAAAAAGGPPGIYASAGKQGIVSADGRFRYVTFSTVGLSASRGTIVARIATNGGRIMDQRTIRGFFEIPAVAEDLSPGGLSADGGTLMLSRQFIR